MQMRTISGIGDRFTASSFACRDKELDRIDLFETYSAWTNDQHLPDAQLENLLGQSKTKLILPIAFLHVTLGQDEKVYEKIPSGVKQHKSN